MRRRMIIRVATAVSLILVLLIGRAVAGFAHPQVTNAPRMPVTGRPAAVVSGYSDVFALMNWITNGCLADDRSALGIFVETCIGGEGRDSRAWGFTEDYTDGAGHRVGTLQNQL